MSLVLVGLAHYADRSTWKNDLGESWSVDRIVAEELSQPVVGQAEGGLNRLLGLAYAVSRRAKRGGAMEGRWERPASTSTTSMTSPSPRKTATAVGDRISSPPGPRRRDAGTQLRSTGRVLEWLAVSLPDKQLEDPRVTAALDNVTSLLEGQTVPGQRRRAVERATSSRWATHARAAVLPTNASSSPPTPRRRRPPRKERHPRLINPKHQRGRRLCSTPSSPSSI